MIFFWSLSEVMFVRRHLYQAPGDMLGIYGETSREKIFLASTHWNNEAILRSHWNTAVLNLVEYLGADDVFVSIVESGSWDDAKGALTELDIELEKTGIQRSIIMNDTTHADEIAGRPGTQGWITTPRGEKEPRRIPYLSRVRNPSLEPLKELAAKGVRYDKVLFLKDVVSSVPYLNARITVGLG